MAGRASWPGVRLGRGQGCDVDALRTGRHQSKSRPVRQYDSGVQQAHRVLHVGAAPPAVAEGDNGSEPESCPHGDDPLDGVRCQKQESITGVKPALVKFRSHSLNLAEHVAEHEPAIALHQMCAVAPSSSVLEQLDDLGPTRRVHKKGNASDAALDCPSPFECHAAILSRKKAHSGKQTELVLPHPWTEEEVQEIEAGILAERPRGAEPRYWEDVNEGEGLDVVAKGPIGMTDEIAFVVGGEPRPSAFTGPTVTWRRSSSSAASTRTRRYSCTAASPHCSRTRSWVEQPWKRTATD